MKPKYSMRVKASVSRAAVDSSRCCTLCTVSVFSHLIPFIDNSTRRLSLLRHFFCHLCSPYDAAFLICHVTCLVRPSVCPSVSCGRPTQEQKCVEEPNLVPRAGVTSAPIFSSKVQGYGVKCIRCGKIYIKNIF